MIINSFGLEFGSSHQGSLPRTFSSPLLCRHRQVTWSPPSPCFSATVIMIAPLPSSTAVWIN